MSLTDRQIRDRVWQASWKTQGRAPNDGDYNYWVEKWPELEARALQLGDPEYAMNRLLGKGASGADVPPFGEFANPPTPYRAVPPSPWLDPPAPKPSDPPTSDPPQADDPPEDEDDNAATMLDAIERLGAGVEQLATAAAQVAQALDAVRAKGVRVHF